MDTIKTAGIEPGQQLYTCESIDTGKVLLIAGYSVDSVLWYIWNHKPYADAEGQSPLYYDSMDHCARHWKIGQAEIHQSK